MIEITSINVFAQYTSLHCKDAKLCFAW